LTYQEFFEHNPELSPIGKSGDELRESIRAWTDYSRSTVDPEPFFDIPGSYESPELGGMILDYLSDDPRSGSNLGRHWSTDPAIADEFAGIYNTWNLNDPNKLRVRMRGDWEGLGEDPDRTNTGGQHFGESEVTLLPDAPITVRDVQVYHPEKGDWISVLPEPQQRHAAIDDYDWSSVIHTAATDFEDDYDWSSVIHTAATDFEDDYDWISMIHTAATDFEDDYDWISMIHTAAMDFEDDYDDYAFDPYYAARRQGRLPENPQTPLRTLKAGDMLYVRSGGTPQTKKGEVIVAATPTPRQLAYASDLQNRIRERLTWKFDRDNVRGSFTPPLNPETMARVRELRAEGRNDEAKALTEQARAEQYAAAEAAMDAYLARRKELADADINAMDRASVSAFIDEAKKYLF